MSRRAARREYKAFLLDLLSATVIHWEAQDFDHDGLTDAEATDVQHEVQAELYRRALRLSAAELPAPEEP